MDIWKKTAKPRNDDFLPRLVGFKERGFVSEKPRQNRETALMKGWKMGDVIHVSTLLDPRFTNWSFDRDDPRFERGLLRRAANFREWLIVLGPSYPAKKGLPTDCALTDLRAAAIVSDDKDDAVYHWSTWNTYNEIWCKAKMALPFFPENMFLAIWHLYLDFLDGAARETHDLSEASWDQSCRDFAEAKKHKSDLLTAASGGHAASLCRARYRRDPD